MSVQVTPASVHVCSTFSRPAAQVSLLQGQQTYLPLCMFDFVALDQHTCLKPSSHVCNSFMRLAGMLQHPCFKRCFEPTGTFVAVAPDHLARRLQLNSTSMHFELHLPSYMFESLATDLQAHLQGAQWLSGRVLDSRPKGSGFEPHRRHCVVVLEQDTFILA